MTRTFILLAILLSTLVPSVRAGDTLIYIDISEHNARVGDTIQIELRITVPDDSIAEFTISFYFGHFGLLMFHEELGPISDGTLVDSWESISWRTFGGINALLTAVRERPPLDGSPAPLGPVLSREVLIYLVAEIQCARDTLTEYEGLLEINPPQTFFSSPSGQLIQPYFIRPARIRVQRPVSGDVDQSGTLDIVDIVSTINCAFRGNCSTCGRVLADVNCSGTVDIIDVDRQIDHVFRAGPPNACP